jgi:hypothetical protein
MVGLLQPPPLLTMAVVLLLTAAALWAGLRRRPARHFDHRGEPAEAAETAERTERAEITETAEAAEALAQPQAGVITDDDEVWGTPDPAPPPRTPFSYDRLVAAAPNVDEAEPLTAQPPAGTLETPPEVETVAPAAPQPVPPERLSEQAQQGPRHREQGPGKEQEISLADLFTRAPRRRDEE